MSGNPGTEEEMKRAFILVIFLLVLCSGCATVGIQEATIRPDQIASQQKEIALMLQTQGEGIGYFYRYQASFYNEMQYFNSVIDGKFAVPPSSENYVNVYPSFKQAVLTGAKLAFKEIIMEENKGKKKPSFPSPDYKLQAILANARIEPEVIKEGVRYPETPYILISYYAELLDMSDNVLATKNSEVKGYSPGGACNKAGLEIINWAKAEIDKLDLKKLEGK